jgi:hypothetical protein
MNRTVLNNLTSARRVTFLGRPTLWMFSKLPVLLYFFQIERIVDSGICKENGGQRGQQKETTFLVSGTTEMDC